MGSWPGHGRGQVGSLALAGDRAYYTGADGGVVMLDISNPENIRPLGGLQTRDIANSIALAGGNAYVTIHRGLQIFDLKNAPNAASLGFVDLQDYLSDIQISRTNAFIGAERGLRIYNVSDPQKPTLTGRFDTTGWVFKLRVAEPFAYVVEDQHGLHVLDITNPGSPVLLGSITNTFPAGVFPPPERTNDIYFADVALVNGYAVAAAGGAGLMVIDSTTQKGPAVVASVKTVLWPSLVEVDGPLACVADGAGAIQVIDLSDPLHPRPRGSYKPSTSVQSVDLQMRGGYAYMAVLDGMIVFDLRQPAEPKLVASYRAPYGQGLSVRLQGEFAYLADREGGVQVINLKDLKNPQRISSLNTPGIIPYDLQLVDNRAYIAGYGGGVSVWDLRDSANPLQVGGTMTIGNALDLAVETNLVYVGTTSGLEIWDFTDPAAPTRVGIHGGAPVYGLEKVGRNIFAARFVDGLCAFDIEDPTRPTIRSQSLSRSDAQGIKVAQGYAYVADGWGGLQIYDIRDPSVIRPAGALQLGGYSYDIDVTDTLAVWADGRAVRLVDVSDPARPVHLDSYPLPGGVYGATIRENKAFVANGTWGLTIFEIVASPVLKTSALLNNALHLTWDPQPGIRLQRTSTVHSAVWEDISIQNAAGEINLPIGTGAAFFRLIQD